jgi:hypothetical protein
VKILLLTPATYIFIKPACSFCGLSPFQCHYNQQSYYNPSPGRMGNDDRVFIG